MGSVKRPEALVRITIPKQQNLVQPQSDSLESSPDRESPTCDSGEFALRDVEALSPVEVLRGDSDRVALPLSDQVRGAIEKRIRKNRAHKFTLFELFLVLSVVSVLLALFNWIPIHIYALCLGCMTALMLTGIFKSVAPKYRFAAVFILLAFYLITAAVLIVRHGF